jgi:hypothetical protein
VCIKVLKLHGRLGTSPSRRLQDIRAVRGMQFAIAIKEEGKPVNLSTPMRLPLVLQKMAPPASRRLLWCANLFALQSMGVSKRVNLPC